MPGPEHLDDLLERAFEAEAARVVRPAAAAGQIRARARRRSLGSVATASAAVLGMATVVAVAGAGREEAATPGTGASSVATPMTSLLGIPTTPDPLNYDPADMRVPAGRITQLAGGTVAYMSTAGLLCIQFEATSFGCGAPGHRPPSGYTRDGGPRVIVGQVPARAARVVVSTADGRKRDAAIFRVDGLTSWRVWALAVPVPEVQGDPSSSRSAVQQAEEALRQSRGTSVVAYDARGRRV
ncbi:hypothetical protein [Motilibacter deserti]|uniref:Uncharacterized protein n=1 Tax=Motilibacter deserti TaxID=2714956 RepID=A0ABX0GWQ3_9ACTN|nr:hypothetical protein [Motilibacter deserti]NHC14978.1 hypothetical protein [Motilibacter deserti]